MIIRSINRFIEGKIPKDIKLKLRENYRSKLYKKINHRIFLAFKSSLKTHSYNYEPLEINGKIYESKRDWKKRWKLIKTELQNYSIDNIMDVGCAEGWFLRKASEELNCFGIGIEMSKHRVIPSELARLYDGKEQYATIKSKLNPELIQKLPKVDAIVCLSVVHHIVYKEGIEQARKFIEALSKRTNKLLIFEMGTNEESRTEWSRNMPEMEEGQAAFIKTFLESSGLKNVREIGKTKSIEKDSDRILFVAEPL